LNRGEEVRKRKQRYTTFSKQDLLFIKKYPRLFTSCSLNHIPYDLVNRCYKRYIKLLNDESYMMNLEYNGYERWWFGNDKDRFQTAISIYISNRMNGVKYCFKKYTRGDVSFQIARMCGFEKYTNIEYKNTFDPSNCVLDVQDVKITNIDIGEVFLSMDFASNATMHFEGDEK
jgi:hypothetical protein